ncbi:hypothetical protein TrVFT333_005071 [Trichoderma virens FT-333]|nr:hypothetical protein TrVFT333_005071 [Trichoderma virens FT-333]
MWKTPTIRISSSGEYNDVRETLQDVMYDEQMRGAGEQQPQGVSQVMMGSPVRRMNDLTPKREVRETLGTRDSPKKVISTSKSPQRNIESSDPSTWKQQLRKINDTPAWMDSSPGKEYTLLTSDSGRHLCQSPAAVTLDEEALSNSSAQHNTNDEEQISTGYRWMESTSNVPKSDQAGDDMKEPATPFDIPNSNSEMPISRHTCEWRSRYLGLSAAFDKLKIELDIALEHQASQGVADGETGNASHQHQYNDYDGIEGLTIIVHRRCKEDLVLNTDLREEELARVEEQ